MISNDSKIILIRLVEREIREKDLFKIIKSTVSISKNKFHTYVTCRYIMGILFYVWRLNSCWVSNRDSQVEIWRPVAKQGENPILGVSETTLVQRPFKKIPVKQLSLNW